MARVLIQHDVVYEIDPDDEHESAILDKIIEAVMMAATPVYQAYNPVKGEGSNRLHLNKGHATNHARHTWYMSDVRRGRIVWDD